MSQTNNLSPPKTPQGFSTFRNDSNLNFSHNSPKIQQQTFNSTNNPFNQSLHYSNIETSHDGHGIYYPNHNHDGVYRCSICVGLREVCPSKRKVSMNSQYKIFGNTFVNNLTQESGKQNLTGLGENSMNNNESFRKQFRDAQSWYKNQRVIQEIHYIPVFHTLLKPEIVNPQTYQSSNSKKSRQSTNEKIRRKPGLNTPLRMASSHQNQIITPRSLRKLAQTIFKRNNDLN